MADSGGQGAAARIDAATATNGDAATTSIQRWVARITAVTALVVALGALIDAVVNTKPIACKLVSALPWCPSQSLIRMGQTAGGMGGDDFDDSQMNPDGAAIDYLAISATTAPTADGLKPVIGKIKIQWKNGRETGHGLKVGIGEPILFSQNEVIKQVEIYGMTYSYPGADPSPTWVSGVIVTTNKRSERFGNTNTSASTICVPDDKERIVGFYGKSGDFVDQLGCVFMKGK